MTLQKHKPVQHKSPLTHCQNTLRQIAKNNPSLCQPHSHIHTHTHTHTHTHAHTHKYSETRPLSTSKDWSWKEKIRFQNEREKETKRVIHPIVSFHNPHSFSSPVLCFSAQTTSQDPLLKIPVCIYLSVCVCVCVCTGSIQVNLYQQHLWQKHTYNGSHG